MKRTICFFAASLAAFAAQAKLNAGNAANPDALALEPIPVPVEMKVDMDAPVAFDAATAVTLDCPDAAAAKWLADHFAAWYGAFAPKVVAGEAGLTLRDGDEAYALKADASGVAVAARTLAGVRWAAYSLRQLAFAKRGTMKTSGYLLPACAISDAPHLKFRGLHLCWFPEVRKEQIERAIRLAALFKFNTVVIEPWGMFRSERHPWWGWPEAKMTKDEVRRLVAVGRDLGVTLVPQIAAFGHAGASRSISSKHNVLDLQPEYEPLYEPGGWNWCLTNPATQRVLRDLIDEMLDVFGHPPFIHLGCDEAQPPTCPDCRKRPYGALVNEHIAGLAACAKEHGARAMIWHDMLLKAGDPKWKGFVASGTPETVKLADTLPRDVIICDWQYSYGDMKEVRTDWPTMKFFHDKGFDVLGCPWMNYNAMKPMADALAGFGGFGILETTWHHLGRRYWVSMYRHGAGAAWGTPSRKGNYGDTSQCDSIFNRALRMVGHDMKLRDYRDTGNVDWQIPPSWWHDN